MALTDDITGDTSIPLFYRQNVDALVSGLNLADDAGGVELNFAWVWIRSAIRLVENYAQDAPDEIKLEAVFRCAGWLCQRPFGAFGDARENLDQYSPAAGAMLSSGAKALLATFVTRNAGVL